MKCLFFLLLFFSNFIYSQNRVGVEYQFVFNNDDKFSEYLFIEDGFSYYFGVGGIYDHFDKTDYKSALTELNENKDLGTVRLFYSANTGKLFEYKVAVKPKPLLAWELLPKIPWKIDADHKEILGYDCQKASCIFRGRTYIVWFAQDIPVSEGPWKLKGLPGLVLEARDVEGQYNYLAKSIIISSDLEEPIIEKEYFDKEIPNSKNLKEVILLENKYLNGRRSEIMASYPSGTVFQNPPIRNSSKETEFEWENEPEKP
ncbi:GLPGLI family protein [Halpernia frigidisoli]|uniref:GLPGLI family protein n=1 Tax=Halpernia frigidisoli TaxID=1125876 RepID=A0A1I3DAX6_9FLAO|nr:GLPGLI family protein [Halpernia frigidisoli]SFH83875.1 GLPGLI family protein [Halpernia frigidisoli]